MFHIDIVVAVDMEVSHTFKRWFTDKQGTVSDKIEIADYSSENGGKGVRAIQDIVKDEVLFTIPRTTLLSITTSDLGRHVDLSSLQGWAPLILTLMYEFSKDSSGWYGYLQILPKEFTTPMFWSADELSQLKGTSIQDKIGREEAEKTYHETLLPIIQAHPELFPAAQCDVHAFHRMGSLIMAYSFNVDNEGGGDEDSDQEDKPSSIAMVPFADLLNANESLNNARLFYDPEQLKMVAVKDIRTGDQIYNTYGPLPSSDLLRRYGYLESMNVEDYPMPNDVVEIDALLLVQTLGEDSSTQTRIDYLLDEGVLEDCFVLEMGELPPELIVSIATLQLSTEEFQKYHKKGRLPKPELTEPVSTAIEDVLQKRLAMYPSTLEKDVESLHLQQDVSFAHRAALLIRISEQRILKQALETVLIEAPERPSKRRKM